MDRVAFETARLELARLRIKPGNGRSAALEHALKLCARTLKCERVGYWELATASGRLVNKLLYHLSRNDVSAGELLAAARYPAYWAALHEKRVIPASNARTDPATCELAESYLAPLDIGSMLDAPVFRAGELCGVVCFEHVGAPRVWSVDELNFASAAGDLASMLLEQADRIEAQEQVRLNLGELVAAEKLQVLEGLSKAIAHDFANLIMAVDLVAACLRAREGEDRQLSESLEGVSHIAGGLLGQLRRFGERKGAPAALPLRQVIERIVPILATLTRGIAVLDVVLDGLGDGDAPAVTADKVEQIVLNLTLNARDAIDIRGTIGLRARHDGDALLIEVADDGCGMSPTVLERIWEPYFTTKEKGTGLGLATVRSIVHDAGGTIAVQSVVGEGTTFRVRLPRAAVPALA